MLLNLPVGTHENSVFRRCERNNQLKTLKPNFWNDRAAEKINKHITDLFEHIVTFEIQTLEHNAWLRTNGKQLFL